MSMVISNAPWLLSRTTTLQRKVETSAVYFSYTEGQQMAGLFRQTIRSFSVGRMVLAKGDAQDPIQRLFVDKLREYGLKAKQTGGLFEAPAEITKGLNDELEAIERRRNPNKTDMSKFPTLQFSDADVDAPGIGAQVPIAPDLKDAPSKDVRVVHADPFA